MSPGPSLWPGPGETRSERECYLMNIQSKQSALAAIEDHTQVITAIADRIWSYAETSLQEYQSCALYVEECRKAGFTVEENYCGIPTAFAASYGSGRPHIGILAEYDALSGLSQRAGSIHQEECIPGGNGHGCGHNLLGAGSFAAALGIKAYLQEHPGCGTLTLYGCPGEEGWASKAYMAREHIWDNLDAAFCWHPEDCNEVVTGSSNACLQYLYKFTGLASHASGAPEKGRSALDAVELMNIGVQFLREHMGTKARIHYAMIDTGGSSPNVVQPHASVLYYIRENHITDCMELKNRVDRIAQGAALMTDTTMEKVFIDGLADSITNRTLEDVLYDNFNALGVPSYTEEELRFTDQLAATYTDSLNGPRAIPGLGSSVDEDYAEEVRQLQSQSDHSMNDFLLPHFRGSVFRPGSTDVGDVSWNTPTAQIHVAAWPNGEAGHSWQNVSCVATSVGHKAALHAGRVMACAAIDLFESPAILEKAREEWKRRTHGSYICPFPPEAKPEIKL